MTVPQLTEKDLQSFHEGIRLVREISEKSQKTSDDLAKLKNVSESIKEFETKQADMVAKQTALENENRELKEKQAKLEAKTMSIGGANSDAQEAKKNLKEFEDILRKGSFSVNMYGPETQKTLRTDQATNGGFLARPEIASEILKDITEINPIRSVARIYKTTDLSVLWNKKTGGPTSQWVGETEEGDESSSTYGQERIDVHFLSGFTDYTRQMASNPHFNIAAELRNDAAEDLAQVESLAFIKGNTTSRPQGLLIDSRPTRVASGDASFIEPDAMLNISSKLKGFYRKKSNWLLNADTLFNHIYSMKAGNGTYLFQPSLAVDLPSTILGRPYVECPDMPNVEAGADPIALGDWFSAYVIVDNPNIEFTITDEYTKATKGMIRYVWYHGVGGKVIKPEAMKVLRIGTSV